MLTQINYKKDLNELLSYEWIETNGLGGWASSTIIGANTRRYHSLLMTAPNTPVDRYALVSKFDETLTINDEKYSFSTNIYPGAVHPEGYLYFEKFERKLFPEISFKIKDITIKKTIACIYGENTVIVSYEFFNNTVPVEIEIKPFICSRNYHSLQNGSQVSDYTLDYFEKILRLEKPDHKTRIFIKTTDGEFVKAPDVYYNFEYPQEKERGLDYNENLFTPGFFKAKINPNSKICILISTEEPHLKIPNELFMFEFKRRNDLLNKSKSICDVENILLLAADQFIVRRDKQLKTIIAGYHWFGDWGRDTMISLPGLTLSTKKYDEAKKILKAFTNYINQGMLPNRFPDQNEFPEYNTVDATLWFFIAVYYYYLETNDKNFVLNYIYPKLIEIIEWHERGTRYNIYEDADGLIYSGDEYVQLTWMDAKVGDWVVTPRTGKAVEINSLWFNALSIMNFFANELNNKEDAAKFARKSRLTLYSFNELFWNEQNGYLFDVINGNLKDDSFRPNQIFAIGLPFPLLTKNKAKSILKLVEKELLTSFGLRSLSPKHKDYKKEYVGDQKSRDGAYHQGTVWSWLIGIYSDSLYYVYNDKAIPKIEKIFNDLIPHLSEACVGSISEIFDGDFPHKPKGAIAQAWSVAEYLRIYKKYNINLR